MEAKICKETPGSFLPGAANQQNESNSFASASVTPSGAVGIALVGGATRFIAFATTNEIFFKRAHNYPYGQVVFCNEPQSSNILPVLPQNRGHQNPVNRPSDLGHHLRKSLPAQP
jgi:hypothetical protein